MQTVVNERHKSTFYSDCVQAWWVVGRSVVGVEEERRLGDDAEMHLFAWKLLLLLGHDSSIFAI